MSVYSSLVFLHIVGALALFSSAALEWAGLLGLRRATTIPQAREWARLLGSLRVVEGPAALVILATGLDLGATRWGHQAWIALGLLGLVLIAALGAMLTRRRAAVIAKSVGVGEGAIPPALRASLADPMLYLAAFVRTSLALGVVYVMSVKPNPAGALAAVGIALLAGVAAGIPGFTREDHV